MGKTTTQLKPRAAIASMDPYRPPSSGRSGKLRLDFNENTVGCSPRVRQAMRAIATDDLAVYPEYEEALPRFAAYFGVAPDQMTLTNGTDEAIQLVINTYVSAGDAVLLTRPKSLAALASVRLSPSRAPRASVFSRPGVLLKRDEVVSNCYGRAYHSGKVAQPRNGS